MCPPVHLCQIQRLLLAVSVSVDSLRFGSVQAAEGGRDGSTRERKSAMHMERATDTSMCDVSLREEWPRSKIKYKIPSVDEISHSTKMGTGYADRMKREGRVSAIRTVDSRFERGRRGEGMRSPLVEPTKKFLHRLETGRLSAGDKPPLTSDTSSPLV